jgi:hypothetical protein
VEVWGEFFVLKMSIQLTQQDGLYYSPTDTFTVDTNPRSWSSPFVGIAFTDLPPDTHLIDDDNDTTCSTGSVAAKFEVTAYSKLAPAKISNLCIFEYTYVYSNIHGHFVDDYRIWTPFDSCPVNSKLWVSRKFEVMGFVTI